MITPTHMIAPIDFDKDPAYQRQIIVLPKKKGLSRRAFLGGLAALVGAGLIGETAYLLRERSRHEREEAQFEAATGLYHKELRLAERLDKEFTKEGYIAWSSHLCLDNSNYFATRIHWDKAGTNVMLDIEITPKEEKLSTVIRPRDKSIIIILDGDTLESVSYQTMRDLGCATVRVEGKNAYFVYDRQGGVPYDGSTPDEIVQRAQPFIDRFFTEVGRPTDIAARVRQVMRE